MRNAFKLALMTVPFVAMGVGFIAYTISTKAPPAQREIAEHAVPVRVIVARKTAIAPKVSGFGLIAPARSYEAIAQVSGTTEYVNPLLKKGDILPEGSVLVRLSDSDYKLAIAQARANIRAAEARLAEIGISGTNLKAILEIEEESLALKESELKRLKRLHDAGAASQTALDGKTATYLAQRQNVQNQNNSLALLPTQKQAQQEQIAVHQAALKIAELALERTELRLPFAARVAAVSVEFGQVVRNGQTVASFDGIDTAEVAAQIPAADLQRLFRQRGTSAERDTLGPAALAKVLSKLGLQARVTLKLGSDYVEWPAVVDRISNSIDPKTGTVGVIVRVDKAYASAEPGTRPPLTKGMFVEATLEAIPVEAIAVPRGALRKGQIMLADSENRLRLVPVTIAFFQDRFAVISSGIEDGTKVLVNAPVPMIEGMLLDPFQDEELMREIAKAGVEK